MITMTIKKNAKGLKKNIAFEEIKTNLSSSGKKMIQNKNKIFRKTQVMSRYEMLENETKAKM